MLHFFIQNYHDLNRKI